MPNRRGGFEQWRRFIRRHGGFEPGVRFANVLMEVARKERRQRQFGKHDQLHAALVRPLHQPDHARDGDRSRFGLLDRPKLGGGDGNDAGQQHLLS